MEKQNNLQEPKKFYYKNFLMWLKRSINNWELIDSDEIMNVIQYNDLNKKEYFELFETVMMMIEHHPSIIDSNVKEFIDVLEVISIIFWREELSKYQDDIKEKVKSLLAFKNQLNLKKSITNELKRAYDFFTLIILKREVFKEDLLRLDWMLRGSFKTIKWNPDFDLLKLSSIKNIINSMHYNKVGIYKSYELVWLYQDFTALISDNKM